MSLRLIAATVTFLLTGCTHYYHSDPCDVSCGEQAQHQSIEQAVKLTETGHGAVSELKTFSHAQKEILAMRASKLDAFRALSERLYGTSILGSSKVGELVLVSDHLRTTTESLLRGVKVVSTRRLAVGAYETVVELVISPQMQLCLTNPAYYQSHCSVGAVNTELSHNPAHNSSGFYFID